MWKILDELIPLFEVPSYHLIVEAILLVWVCWLLMRKKKWPEDKIRLTPEEEDQIIRAWKPKPLVEEEEGSSSRDNAEHWGVVNSRAGKYVIIDGVKYLNMATHNYLGLVEEPELDKEAIRCVRKYGVGSCGPRGFYGSVDVHLELEEKIAKFLGLEETALYSYAFTSIASAIPSYAKAGDIIFADEQVNFSIQKGLQASRSFIQYFKHNDYNHLLSLLQEQEKMDMRNPKKAKTVRRFCVVEGIYSKTGEMCPLNEITPLCRKYKVRLFVDESVSFGVLGKTGKGITEQLNVPVEDLDLISGSLENAIGAFGGFIVGSSFVVDHQRISGLGYCFSASLPPLLAGVGIAALKIIEKNSDMVKGLQKNCVQMHQKLQALENFTVSGHELSPVKHIFLKDESKSRHEKDALLGEIILHVKECEKIALIKPSYLEGQEVRLPPPSIRLCVNRLLLSEDLDKVVTAIDQASKAVLNKKT